MAAGSSAHDKTRKIEAFESIVSEYESRLLRYAARIVRDQSAAQDIVQDTFIRLFKNWEQDMAPSSALSSWLYRVAHNCSVDHLRKETRRRMRTNLMADEGSDLVRPGQERGSEISDAALKAHKALQELNLRERQLVILKVYEEKSYREIGDITGLTVGNVGYILHHAMKKLACILKEDKAI